MLPLRCKSRYRQLTSGRNKSVVVAYDRVVDKRVCDHLEHVELLLDVELQAEFVVVRSLSRERNSAGDVGCREGGRETRKK